MADDEGIDDSLVARYLPGLHAATVGGPLDCRQRAVGGAAGGSQGGVKAGCIVSQKESPQRRASVDLADAYGVADGFRSAKVDELLTAVLFFAVFVLPFLVVGAVGVCRICFRFAHPGEPVLLLLAWR